MMTVDEALKMENSQKIVHLAEGLAAMKVQFRKGLISKDVLRGGIHMARIQVNLNSNSKYSEKNEWQIVLRIAVCMSHSKMINERYDWKIYQ